MRKTAAAKKPATAKKAAPRKTTPPAKAPAKAPAAPPIETCPRCGTATFGPEQRIRADGNRTVRYSILVCERGHTFAHPLVRSG